jgi:hypothetical protein
VKAKKAGPEFMTGEKRDACESFDDLSQAMAADGWLGSAPWQWRES